MLMTRPPVRVDAVVVEVKSTAQRRMPGDIYVAGSGRRSGIRRHSLGNIGSQPQERPLCGALKGDPPCWPIGPKEAD
jgi:hypothetical protein